jgi:intracellular sulfur oxidation DsrE/DsrF family protein
MGNSTVEPKKRKRLIRVLYLSLFAIVIGLVIFISRGPYISNALKRLILPELETALRQKVIAKKIYVNIFPFFVEAKGLKVFDENGKRIIYAKRVKGYIEPLGLFSKCISIRRLVIKEPMISTEKERIEKTIKNFKAYLKKESTFPFKVRVKVVEVSDGIVSLSDKGIKSFIATNGLEVKVILGTDSRITMTVKKFDLRKEGLPELSGDINASFVLRKDEIEIKDLKIGSHGSEFKGSGSFSKGKLILKTDSDLIVDSLKRIFNLKERKGGKVSAKGKIILERFTHRLSASDSGKTSQ